ncbi:type II toxin-antitoxin system RelE/ParE family toxin [Sphingomonas sp. KR3-1]|uniref:type II toxin-antitoxin system RelE/ParE family toxin n=1 Tax=Sphingomonas sp. KR3-1 TaxID=3156611 RepID=UPI0032B398EF
MARAIWLPEALEAVDAIRAYIQQFDPQAAQRVTDRLIRAGYSLRDFPSRGRPSASGLRELVTVPPYVLRYLVVGDMVYIATIKHGPQRRG